MAGKLQKFLKRAKTTLIGALVLIALAWYVPKPGLHLALLICGVIGTLEFEHLAKAMGHHIQKVTVIFTVAYGIAGLYWPALKLEWLIYFTPTLAFLLSLKPPFLPQKTMINLALTLIASIYLGFSLIGLSALFALHPTDPEKGRMLLLFCFALVWAGDSAAYIAGSSFGKHKIAPVVSPKKSVEGTLANFVGNFIAAAAGKYTVFPELTWLDVGLLVLIFGLLGFWGDLVESTWKRTAQIKDSGTIFPGHGGVLDRVDSIFLTAPLLYVFMAWKLG